MFKNFIKKIKSYLSNDKIIQDVLLNQGKILTEIFRDREVNALTDIEWKVFSQWGEDGIIQFIIKEIEIKHKTFIEFGVENFTESNCRYLMMSCDWQGFVIDGDENNINSLKQEEYFWKYDLQAHCEFIDKDNINDLLKLSGFDSDLGLLSVDLDGNDYHVLKNISEYNPRIIISEFNPIFGVDRAITVPYDAAFRRSDKHYSNLYFGSSIKAIKILLHELGYTLIGTGRFGGNAFFVKKDLLTPTLRSLSENPINFNANFRESRDENGNLNYLRGEERYEAIKGLPVLNIETNKIEEL
jgi:hypothetical protein